MIGENITKIINEFSDKLNQLFLNIKAEEGFNFDNIDLDKDTRRNLLDAINKSTTIFNSSMIKSNEWAQFYNKDKLFDCVGLNRLLQNKYSELNKK